MLYDRFKAVAYAHQWAYGRNPRYYNFDKIGGDCTNFVSQCLYAGCGVMNYTRELGWYYRAPNDRTAAWSGVEHLYKFLISNKKPGPHATELPLSFAQPGDIVQLSFDGETYGHTLFVVDVLEGAVNDIYIAAHTYDSDNRSINSYQYQLSRLLHIDGIGT